MHHSAKIHVSGNVHANTIEGFLVAREARISDVYHSVSAKHLQDYLDEYVYRYNHQGENIFGLVMERAANGE